MTLNTIDSVLEALRTHQVAASAYEEARRHLREILLAWLAQQRAPGQAIAWLKSQPLELTGVPIPEDIMDTLPSHLQETLWPPESSK